jgi:hypothetical protein
MDDKARGSHRITMPVGSHDSMFNFVVPRRRRTTKTAGSEPYNWDPWSQAAQMGYGPEANTEAYGAGDPYTNLRIAPYLQRAQGNPEYFEDAMQALQVANKHTQAYIDRWGGDQYGSPVERFAQGFADPETTILNPENTSQGYFQAKQDARAELVQNLIQRGVPPDQAIGRAEAALKHVMGTPDEFHQAVSGRLATTENPPWSGPLATAGAFTSIPSMLALTGARSLTDTAGQTIPSMFGYGNGAANERFQELVKARQLNQLQKGEYGTGVGDVVSGLNPLNMTPWFGDTERAQESLASGAQKLWTGGTGANQILNERSRQQREQMFKDRQAYLGRTLQPGRTPVSPEDFELLKARSAAGGRQESAGDRGVWGEAHAAATNPYRNLYTGDPWLGASTALESARASRKWHPSEWKQMAGDWITGGDSTSDYLERQGSESDDPNADRFGAYNRAMQAFHQGRFDPTTDDLSMLPVAHDEELGWWNPARMLYNVSGGHLGTDKAHFSGLDPGEFRAQMQNRGFGRAARGQYSARDMAGIDQDLSSAQKGVVGWGSAPGHTGVQQQWSRNRNMGDAAVASTQGTYGPVDTTKTGRATKWAQAKTAAVLKPAQKWAATRPRSTFLRAEKWATDWYPQFEAQETKDTGFSEPEYQHAQGEMRQNMFNENQFSQMPYGTPMPKNYSWATPSEQAYGKGLYERFHSYGPGRLANNKWAPFQRFLSTTDESNLDPVLNQQRDEISKGNWRPGEMVDPLVNPHGIGWTHPWGRLGEFLGFEPNAKAQERDITANITRSPQYQKLLAGLRNGMVSARDFLHLTRGVPGIQYDPQTSQALQGSARPQARQSIRSLAKILHDQDNAVNENMIPMISRGL